MSKNLRKFENHSQYNAYTADTSNFILPNVSICVQEGDVHYNPSIEPLETRIVAKFNVTDTSNPTRIASATTNFSSIEIDGKEQPSVTTGYTFSTTGEHTVKYGLDNVVFINASAFTNCDNLTSVIIPDGIRNINGHAFEKCTGLTSITIPNSVKKFNGGYNFAICRSLTRINSNTDGVFNLPSGLTSIEASDFQECTSLTSITIPDSVTSIGIDAFGNCTSLTNVTIPDSVTSIGNGAFNSASTLTSVTIGSGVTSIGRSAFQYCRRLISITVEAITPPSLGSYPFRYVTTLEHIYVPSSSVNAYKAASGWSTYASKIQAIP